MAFRKKHSTNIATIELMTKISQGIDNNEHTLGVFLDFAKAFQYRESWNITEIYWGNLIIMELGELQMNGLKTI